jgi:diguanylate cyclase (GGDEF)-like protein
MPYQSHADPPDAGTPVSVEAAFRRVRLLVGALVLARLWSAGSLPVAESVLLVACFVSVNVVSYMAERDDRRTRIALGVVQLLADTLVVLLVVWAQHGRGTTESADWAVLVLPVIEGAIRFRVAGAFASWLVVAGGYSGLNMASTPSLETATIAQRLTVALLVALPVGYLAEQLVAEIDAHRRGRAQAEERSALLHAAALGGRRISQLDVDEILDVIRTTVGEMGFADAQVFELADSGRAQSTAATVRPVRGSDRDLQVVPDDDQLRAAAELRATGRTVILSDSTPTVLALPIPMIDDQFVVLTAAWPEAGEPPSAPIESMELFAAQAGASLHNAQQHTGLEQLKNRLDHEASHDPLTGLANRRRFALELDRAARRNGEGDLVGVLFVDLDGFKDVNDKYGHEAGNELLVAVAARLRACVRPGDVVARIGGDEFTIMLTRLESVTPAAAIAQRICDLLSDPFLVGRQEIQISTSVGVALDWSHLADTDDLVRRADAAMYHSKSRGKARWTMDPGAPNTGQNPENP